MYKNIIDKFREIVLENKNKTAIRHNDKEINFTDLYSRANLLSKQIQQRTQGIIKKPIAVLLPKSINQITTDIGITYSANFFMNLDVKTPEDRLKNTLDVIKPIMVVTDSEMLQKFPTLLKDTVILNVDEICWEVGDMIAERNGNNTEALVDTDPFCIINTSGSTGVPKGGVLNHRNFIDFLSWAEERFELDGSEIVGALTPIVFDVYHFELCMLLMLGSTIVILDKELAVFPVRLLEEVQKKQVNFIFWVPTIMVNIANKNLLEKIPIPEVKSVWFIGEVFPTVQFNYWRRKLKYAEFVNLYGPIECTVACSYYVAEKEIREDEPLPIGIPCKNTDIIVLNEMDQVCETGELGELCVRGASVAMGYYNNVGKTSQVFVQNPLNESYTELIYRTGDLAYVNEEGQLIFKGRRDNQVKHMGYRIELGEIEHMAVNVLEIVKNCCVVYNRSKKEITMFYEKKEKLTLVEIKKALSNKLPRYMVPAVYIEIEEMPRNTNGKIDRLKLNRQINEEN